MTPDRVTLLVGIPGELAAFGELAGSLSQDVLTSLSRCAGWSVADVIGHVVGTVVDITHGRLEGMGTAAVNERQARERSGRTARELTAELEGASPVLCGLLASLPEGAWEGPAPGNPDYTLRFPVEAIWYDAYLHGDDIRDAVRVASARGDRLRCAVHHVVGYLEHQHWGLGYARAHWHRANRDRGWRLRDQRRSAGLRSGCYRPARSVRDGAPSRNQRVRRRRGPVDACAVVGDARVTSLLLVRAQ